MSDVASLLLDDVRATLCRELASAVGKHDLSESFATWLTGEAVPGLGIAGALATAVEATGASRTASAVAVLGYAAEISELSAIEKQYLQAGVEWVIGCEPVVRGTPMPFCMDAVTLAGILLGARKCNISSFRNGLEQWLHHCRAATSGGQGLGEWQEWLMALVAKESGINWQAKTTENVDGCEVRVALRSKGFDSNEEANGVAQDEHCAIQNMMASQSSGVGSARAAIRLSALDWTRRRRPTLTLNCVSRQALADLLRRVPSGLKKWTWEAKPRTKTSPAARQWHVENEYHVQNMLWLLLSPLFPDLIDEDSTPKVGPVQPRADIGIPSLRLIVEAKFMRADDPPKKMVEQIAEDVSLYLVAGSKYDCLIPFIWDDSRRTEHHDEMIRGLRQLAGVFDAIVVPRPGSMTMPDTSPNATKVRVKGRKSSARQRP